MKDIVVRPEAQLELQHAYQWYQDKRPGLGDDFLLCIDAGIEQMQKSPEMFPVVYRNVRRVLIRRFPYGIFYVVEPERILILSFFHGRRNPKTVLNRH